MRLMARSLPRYLWQQPSWPELTYNHQAVAAALLDARRLQGEIEGKVQAIGLA
jgi:hypothetical protein